MTDLLCLTDDEVVALALRRPTPWPGGIPTVEGTQDAVTESAFRGNRSLLVRELLDGDGNLPDDIGRTIDALFDAPGRVVVYLGDADLRRTSWGIASAHYVAGDRWLFETVSAIGVHKIAWRPVDEHRTYLTALLDAALVSGPDRGSDTSDAAQWLCILAENAGEGVLASVRRGELLVRPLVLGDDAPSTGAHVSSTVGDAVEALLLGHAPGALSAQSSTPTVRWYPGPA